MRKYFLLLALIAVLNVSVLADYDPSKTEYPYQYDVDSQENINGNPWNEASTHNANANVSANAGVYLNFTIKDDGAYDLSSYKWYVEVYGEYKDGRKTKWKMESIGTINLNRLADESYGDIINPAPKYTQFYVLPDPNYKFLNIHFEDFGEAVTPSLSFRLVMIKEADANGDEVIKEVFYEIGRASCRERV